MLVVCDGVSSATDSDLAAVAAADTARDVMTAAPPAPDAASPAVQVEYYSDLWSQAAHAANAEAALVAQHVGGQNPPSCTFAAAVVDGELVVAGWIGDSRVYWLGDDGTALQLSVDDSWATEQVEHGLPRELPRPIRRRTRSPAGWAPTPPTRPRRAGRSPRRAPAGCSCAPTACGTTAPARPTSWRWSRSTRPSTRPDSPGDLVDWANEQGGHDNITAALARVERTETEPADNKELMMANWTAEVFENEYLADGATDVHAVVTIACSGAGEAGTSGGDAAEVLIIDTSGSMREPRSKITNAQGRGRRDRRDRRRHVLRRHRRRIDSRRAVPERRGDGPRRREEPEGGQGRRRAP